MSDYQTVVDALKLANNHMNGFAGLPEALAIMKKLAADYNDIPNGMGATEKMAALTHNFLNGETNE